MDLEFTQINLSEAEIAAIEEQMAREMADIAADTLYALSKSPKKFYRGLSATIDVQGNNVLASGLTKYILDERLQVMDAILNEIDIEMNGNRFLGTGI